MTYSHPKKHHLKWIAAWRCRAIINRCHLSMLICIQADHNFMTFSNAFISEHWEISPRSFWVENCFITGFGNFWKRAEPRTYRETARTVREIEKTKRNGYKIVFSWRSYAADKEEAENKWAAIWRERNNLQYFCAAENPTDIEPVTQRCRFHVWFMSAIPSGLVY